MFIDNLYYSRERIINRITDTIQEQGADNVTVHGDDEIRYKGSTKSGNWSLFGNVDSGIITLIYSADGYLSVTYQINMQRLFIITSIMSTGMGLVSLSICFGLVSFAWLCGMNWIINVTRHSWVANDMAQAIEEYISY